MASFDTTLKQWGNSLAVTIPADLVKEKKLKAGAKVTVFIISDQNASLEKAFGLLKGKIDVDKAMRIIDGKE